MTNTLIENFLKSSKNTIYIKIDKQLNILDTNPTFTKHFHLSKENLLSLDKIFTLSNNTLLYSGFFKKQTDQFILEAINNQSLSVTCNVAWDNNNYIIIGEIINKEDQLTIIEKMSKITSQLASTTRELHKKNSLLEIANKEIQEKEQMIISQSRFVAMNELLIMLAHQWRQPLNAISLYNAIMSTKLEHDDFDKEVFQNSIEKIDKTLQSLSSTINLFSSKLAQENKETISINQVIDEVCNLIYPTIKSHDIKPVKNLNSKEEITLIPSILAQICFIVVQNTIDAFEKTKQKEKIFKVTTYDESDYVVIEYSDNAGGINEEIFQKVFEPYFSTKNEKNDVGLGLYTAKLLCEKILKGSINLSNKNNGLTITIKISKYLEENYH